MKLNQCGIPRLVGLSAIILLISLANNCTSHSQPMTAQVIERKELVTMEQQAQRADAPQPQPDPKHSPEQVVGFVLEASRRNDTPEKDSGIRTTFSFASPGNREMTGPIDRFIELVKNPLYRPLINHRRTERSPVKVAGDLAQQKVTLIDEEGRRATFLFTLSKQQAAPFKDCWMTDGVERLPNEESDKDRQIAQGNGHLLKG
ncbi:MAG: DUF4864 domain-containing protein [Acidobacteriota bacterium]|nr:DUF4864 domain-containing protein [Acidobacteriota bacterium]